MKRILLLDNDPDHVDTLRQFLSAAGFEVLVATSQVEAERLLAEHWVPVLLLDVRLIDDDDDKDKSGLIFSLQPECSASFRLILTRDPDTARLWMRVGGSGRAERCDVLAKEDGYVACAARLEQIFANEVGVNWKLALHWSPVHGLSAANIAEQIEPGLSRSRLVDRVGELEDLLRRQFHDYKELTVGRQLWHSRRQTAVTALAVAADRPSEALIIVCGERNLVNEEARYYARPSAATLARGAALAALQAPAETTHFASFALAGIPLEDCQTLADYYAKGATTRQFREVVSSLRDTLTAWMARQLVEAVPGTNVGRLGLDRAGLADYTVQELTSRLVDLGKESARHRIGLTMTDDQVRIDLGPTLSEVSYLNPVPVLFRSNEGDTPAWCESVPGRLTANSLLIGPGNRAWLTDLSGAGLAPTGWFLAELEAIIRFDLVGSEELYRLHELEDVLTADLDVGRLNTSDLNGAERRAALCISAIRVVVREMGLKDRTAYHQALLTLALARAAGVGVGVSQPRREIVQRIHALLAAAMIAHRTGAEVSTAKSAEPAHLWLNEADKRVYRGTEVLKLTKTEFKLFAFLYQHAGELCSNEALFNHVKKDRTYQAHKRSDRTWVHTSLDRLREIIEPDPDNVVYLHNEPGQGYRLYLKPRLR